MVIDFSKINFSERPKLLLCHADDTPIQILSYAFNLAGDFRYNEMSTIEFDLPAYVDDNKTPHYDDVVGMSIIDMIGYGRFILVDPSTSNDGVKEVKHCKAYSLEYELTYKKMSLSEDTYNFYNPTSIENTVMGIILENLPSWHIGSISATLVGKYRTFSEDDVNIYNFIKSTVQETYGCIFDFDTYERTINVRATTESPSVKPVYISLENLAKEIEITENTEDVVTVLDVNGADGVDIRSVNPIGSNKIYNIDHYIESNVIPNSLAEKWDTWKQAVADKQEEYHTLMMQQVSLTSAILAKQNELEDLKNGSRAGQESLAVKKNQQSVLASYLATLEENTEEYEDTYVELQAVNEAIAVLEERISGDTGIEKEIEGLEEEKQDITDDLKDIVDELDIENYFTEDEFEVLNRYFKEDAIQNSSFVYKEVSIYQEDTPVGSEFDVATSERVSFDGGNVSYYIVRDDSSGISVIKKKIYSISGGTAKVTKNGTIVIQGNVIGATIEHTVADNSVVISGYLSKGNNSANDFTSGTLSITGTSDGSAIMPGSEDLYKIYKAAYDCNLIKNGNFDYMRCSFKTASEVAAAGWDVEEGKTYSTNSKIVMLSDGKFTVDFSTILMDGAIITETQLNQYIDMLDTSGTLEDLIASDVGENMYGIIINAKEGRGDTSYWTNYQSERDVLEKIHTSLVEDYVEQEEKTLEQFKSIFATYLNTIGSDGAIGVNIASGIRYLTNDTTDFERFSVEWDLYDYGVDCLSKLAYPSYSFKVDAANFFNLSEFEGFAKRIKLGEKIYLRIKEDADPINPILIGVKIGFDEMNDMSLEFGDTFKSLDSSFSLVDLLDKSVSMGKNVDTKRFGYNSFIDSGASTSVKKFMDSSLDVAKRSVVSSSDISVTWDGSGIRCRKTKSGGGFEDEQIGIINNSIVFTDDAWSSAKMAIGEIFTNDMSGYVKTKDNAYISSKTYYTDRYGTEWDGTETEWYELREHDMLYELEKTTGKGSAYGIAAPYIVGNMIAGNNLTIESVKPDGVNMAFKVDADGAVLYNSRLDIVRDDGSTETPHKTHVAIDPNIGIGIGTYPLIDPSTGAFIENNAKFWVDINGNIHMKGVLEAAGGTFSGDISAASGTFKGRIQASEYLDSQGRSVLEGGKLKGQYIQGKGIEVQKKIGQGDDDYITTFKVDENGDITLGGNITWDAQSNPLRVLYTVNVPSGENPPTDDYDDYPNSDGSGYTGWHKVSSSSDSYASYSYSGGKAGSFGTAVVLSGGVTDDNLFDLLTGNGKVGIFSSYSPTTGTVKLAINADYIKAGSLSATRVAFGSNGGTGVMNDNFYTSKIFDGLSGFAGYPGAFYWGLNSSYTFDSQSRPVFVADFMLHHSTPNSYLPDNIGGFRFERGSAGTTDFNTSFGIYVGRKENGESKDIQILGYNDYDDTTYIKHNWDFSNATITGLELYFV